MAEDTKTTTVSKSKLNDALGSDMTTVKIADLKILAKGQLESHRGEGSCKDCPHYSHDGTEHHCNTTGELTCCHCYACKLARSILRA